MNDMKQIFPKNSHKFFTFHFSLFTYHFSLFTYLVCTLFSITASAQYTLKDWNIENIDENSTLHLNVSEYKLNYNHPLPYADWQK